MKKAIFLILLFILLAVSVMAAAGPAGPETTDRVSLKTWKRGGTT